MQIPIACRLTATAAEVQLEEWRELVALSVVASERVSPSELWLRLADDLGRLDGLVRLAQREKACCPFFDFALRIDAGAVTLIVSVPAGAESILDNFPARRPDATSGEPGARHPVHGSERPDGCESPPTRPSHQL